MYYQYINPDKAKKLAENNENVYRVDWLGHPYKINKNSFYLKFFNQKFLMEIPSMRFDIYTRTTKAIFYASFPKFISENVFNEMFQENDFITKVKECAGFLKEDYKKSFKEEFENDVIADVLA